MKKSIIAVFAGLVSVAAFADLSETVVVSFSTPGTDRYADNSVVENGECYAVVWTPAESEFAGINADGSAVAPSEVVVIAPVASGGKCPYVNFQIEKTYLNQIIRSRAGKWGVYLLDTRKWKTDDNGVILTDEKGEKILESVGVKTDNGYVVNGWGAVTALAGTGMSSASASGAVSVTTDSAAPEGAGNLKVNDIKFIGDNVYIFVTGSLSCLQYELKSGDKPSDLGSAPTDGNPQYGKDDGEMVIIRAKKPGAQFFKVNRK